MPKHKRQLTRWPWRAQGQVYLEVGQGMQHFSGRAQKSLVGAAQGLRVARVMAIIQSGDPSHLFTKWKWAYNLHWILELKVEVH